MSRTYTVHMNDRSVELSPLDFLLWLAWLARAAEREWEALLALGQAQLPPLQESEIQPLASRLAEIDELIPKVAPGEFRTALEAWSGQLTRQIELHRRTVKWLAGYAGIRTATAGGWDRLRRWLKRELASREPGWAQGLEYEGLTLAIAEGYWAAALAQRQVECLLCRAVAEAVEGLAPDAQPVAVADAVCTMADILCRSHRRSCFPDILGTEFRPGLARCQAVVQTLLGQVTEPEVLDGLQTIERGLPAVLKADERLVQWLAAVHHVSLAGQEGRQTLYEHVLRRFAARAAAGMRSILEVSGTDAYPDIADREREPLERLAEGRRMVLAWYLPQQEGHEWLQPLSVTERRGWVTEKFVEQPVYLQMEIVTFADLWERAAVAVEFIERVWQTILPKPIKLQAVFWPKEQPMPKPARRLIVAPGSPRWLQLRELLLDGRLGACLLREYEAPPEMSASRVRQIELDIDFGWVGAGAQWQGHTLAEEGAFEPREPKVLRMAIDTGYWQGSLGPELQRQIVALAADLFRSLGAAWGYVDLGHDPYDGVTHYERRIGMQDPPNRWRLWRYARGAFWANLLSAYHVQLLGGSEAVMRDAPGCEVRPIQAADPAMGDASSLFVQMTKPIGEATFAEYQRLESYFAPILPVGADIVSTEVLDSALVARLGKAQDLQHLLEPSVRRVSILPEGALLVEYGRPSDMPVAMEALKRIGAGMRAQYRSIPPLHRYGEYDVIDVTTLAERVTMKPRHDLPALPRISVQPYIVTNAVELAVSFAELPGDDVVQKLRESVDNWSRLTYELPSGAATISAVTCLGRQAESLTWQADLAPVGEDAYIQLILLLDEFSKSVARLAEVRIAPGDARCSDDAI